MTITLSTPEGDKLRTEQATAAQAANPIDSVTLDFALTYLQNNVTDLATAKVYLRNLTKLVFVMRADIARLKKKD